MNRRRFLRDVVSAGSGAWVAAQAGTAQVIRPDAFRINPAANSSSVFTLGCASGDPQPNGIVLWTRVVPEAGAAPSVVWEIATNPNFTSIVLNGGATLDSARDYTVKIVINSPALQPFTQYYYRFIHNNVSSRTCRFKTLPAASSTPNRLRLCYVSCQDYTNGYYTALAHLAQESIDFVVHLGDYIYESIGDPRFQEAQVRVIPPLPSGGIVAASLEDYRYLYRVYRSDLNLQMLHEQFAFIQVWDDHEFANDSYRDFHPDDNPNPSEPTPALRQAANQAWTEYVPSAIAFDPLKGPLESVQLYRSFVFGDLMELVVTDERLYRDGPPCGLEQFDRYVTTGCPERENSSRTMLGASQRDWFLARMHTSQAVWKLWANEMMAMGLKLLNAGSSSIYITLDHWDGYPAERSQLMTQLTGVKNLVAITGDIHSYAAGYLKASYDQAGGTNVGVELVGGSVSSANLTEVLSTDAQLVSTPVPRRQLAIPPGLIELLVRLNNPHIKFFNSSTHGYCLLDITRDGLICVMKQVSTVTEPAATLSVLQGFRVPRDQVQIIKL